MLKIILHGHLYWYTPAKQERLELDFHGNALELLQSLQIPHQEILMVRVNGEAFSLEALLPAGATVEVFPVIAGG